MSVKSLIVFNQRYIEVKKLGQGAFGLAVLVRDLKDDTVKYKKLKSV
jgi:hypothetical protein